MEVDENITLYFAPDSVRRNYTLSSSEDLEVWKPVAGQESIPSGSGPFIDDPGESKDKLFYRIEAEID